MEQYAEVVQDLAGNAVEGASVQVLVGSVNGALATIYDAGGTQQQNPIITGQLGEFAFQAANGKYVLRVLVNGKPYRTVGPLTFYDPADDTRFNGIDPALRPDVNTLIGQIAPLRAQRLDSFPGDTANQRFSAAKAAGIAHLIIPAGVHSVTGLVINQADSIKAITFEPGAQLLLTSAPNAICLDVQSHECTLYGEVNCKSTGTMSDGNNTIGVRCGHPTTGGKAYIRIEASRTQSFSKRGVVFYQPVYVGIERAVSIGDFYGISVEPANGVGGSTVEIGPSYVTGSKRGINLEMCSWATLREPITEYCGDATSADGALHFKGCGNITVIDRYSEQNARNMVKDDAGVVFINGSTFAATAPDIITYTGTAAGDRGTVEISSKVIRARRLDFDLIDNEDLQIGKNLWALKDGSSVRYGHETREEVHGAVASGVWTTVKVIPLTEMTGAPQQKAMYEYVAYAGYADLPTGFDSGTIMNGVLRSYTGANPAWLRLDSSNNLQINIVGSSYGLSYKVVLRRVFPGLQAT